MYENFEYHELDLFNQSKSLIEIVAKDDLPWYYSPCSSSNNFPFCTHTVISRYDHVNEDPKINSRLFYLIEPILLEFCSTKNIPISKIMRCALNLMWANTSYPYTDPHVDYDENHKVFILYLNNSTGDTLVFKEQHKPEEPEILFHNKHNKKLTVEKSVSPKLGLGICFSGKNYHANKFCKDGEVRIVCVVCFK